MGEKKLVYDKKKIGKLWHTNGIWKKMFMKKNWNWVQPVFLCQTRGTHSFWLFVCVYVVCIAGENNLSVWNYTHVIKTFKIPLKETRTLFFYMITRCVNEKQILISKINGYQCRYRINFFSHCDFGRQKKTKSRQFAQLFSLVEYIIINFWKKNISIRLTNFSKDTSLLGDVFLWFAFEIIQTDNLCIVVNIIKTKF